MGQRASDTRGITFEDVEVPAEVSPVPDCLACVLLSAGACIGPVSYTHLTLPTKSYV